MGINTRGLLFGHLTIAQIVEALRDGCGVRDSIIGTTTKRNYETIQFRERDSRAFRTLHVFLNGLTREDYAKVYPGEATLLSFGDFGDSRAIMRTLVEAFGGYLQVCDVMDEPWEKIDVPEVQLTPV